MKNWSCRVGKSADYENIANLDLVWWSHPKNRESGFFLWEGASLLSTGPSSLGVKRDDAPREESQAN